MPNFFSIFLPKDKNLFKKIFALATPVIISNLSRVIMGITDMAMVGHLGASALAAVGMAGMVTWTPMSLGIAFRTGTHGALHALADAWSKTHAGITRLPIVTKVPASSSSIPV